MSTDNTAKMKMEKVQAALDEYELRIGLPATDTPPCESDELNNYLVMSRDAINSLSPSLCDEIAVRLTQAGIYIRRLLNKEKSRISWTNIEICRYACDKLYTVGGKYDKYDVKVELIAKTDSYLFSLLQIRSYSQQRVDRLLGLTEDLNSLKFTYLEVKKTKIKEGQ